MKLKIFIASSALAFAACQSNAPATANQTAKPSPIATATAAPDRAKIRTYDGTGAVTKINLEIGSIELDHEEIKDLMPAMQMEFYVSDKKMLDDLKVGDRVDFILEDNAGAERIVSVKKK